MTPASAFPVVSVLVASYGAERFIERAIRSVLGQTLDDLEVIVVDDVSPDGSADVVAGLAAEDARVRQIRLTVNGGPAAARNRAIAEARGRWVAIVDSDDLIAPERFESLVAAAKTAGADMIADDLLVFQDGRPHGATRFLAEGDRSAGAVDLDLGGYLDRSVLYGPEPNPGFLKPMIRRDRLAASGIRYDETLRIAEDDDFVIRLLLAGLRYRLIGVPGYFYRKHDHSISHRLTPRALEAMVAADRALAAQVITMRPDLAPAARARSRSYAQALALERFIAALKARRPVRAMAEAIRHPAMLPLLRMPVAGMMRRLRPSGNAEESVMPDDELASLVARRDRLTRS